MTRASSPRSTRSFCLKRDGSDPAEVVAAEAGLAELIITTPGLQEASETDLAMVSVWEDADKAAAWTCCARWDRLPGTAKLELVMPQET